ncbi:hypothetical protein V2G26_015395 [Clonostachys chloroleuca]
MSSKQYANTQPAGFTNRIERVAVVGASGTVGTGVVRELLKTGKHTVTAITRASGGSANLPEGVKVAPVDYDDEASLIAALKGQQFLMISLPSSAIPTIQPKLIAAAGKAGVPYIMPNCYGPDFVNESLSKETLTGDMVRGGLADVEKTGTASWIALVCSFWYEFSLSFNANSYGFDIPNKKVTFFDDGSTAINTSTWDQCGRAVASLLSLKELPDDESDRSATVSDWKNRPLYISSFKVSQREMLDSIQRVQGTTDADWVIEHESSSERYKRGQELLKTGDYGGFVICLYTRVFYPNGDGDIEERYGLANEVLGLPKEDLDEASARAIELAAKNANPYQGKGR